MLTKSGQRSYTVVKSGLGSRLGGIFYPLLISSPTNCFSSSRALEIVVTAVL